MRTLITICFFAAVYSLSFGQVFPEDAWGVYSWTQFTQIDKNSAPWVKGRPIITGWANLEPQNGLLYSQCSLKTLQIHSITLCEGNRFRL